jgi:hypothetical protein
LSGNIEHRPELHPAFHTSLGGRRESEAFKPAPQGIVLQDFIKDFTERTGRMPTYYDLTRGYAPNVKVTDEMLENLSKAGHKDGGHIKPLELNIPKLKEGNLVSRAMEGYRKSADFLKNLGIQAYEEAKEELPTLLHPRAIPDVVANVGAGIAGIPSDIANLIVPPLNEEEVPNYKPQFGSEDLQERLKQSGITTGTERPLVEGIATLASPRGIAKTGKEVLKHGARLIEEGRVPGLINPRQNIIPEVGGDFGVSFFRPSEDTIRGHKMDTMPGNQWHAWLQSNAPKSSKKELETAGTMDWLKDNKDKVTKTDIINHLRENEPRLRSKTYKPYGDHPYEVVGSDDTGWDVVDTSMGDKPISSHGSQDDAYQAMHEVVDVTHPISKYKEYTLPGGEDYREIVIQDKPFGIALNKSSPEVVEEAIRSYGESALPRLSESQWNIIAKRLNTKFESSHFPEATNPIAHLRVNHREDANGNPTLFIEELQSDWGQKGKKQGFDTGVTIKKDANDMYRAYDGNGNLIELRPSNNEGPFVAMSTEEKVREALPTSFVSKGIPKGPYVQDTKDWTALALKQAIKEAVDNGKTQVAWTTGTQQAERYDLSRHLSSVSLRPSEYSKDKVHLMAIDHDGNPVIEKTVKENELDNYIGKDLANKLINTPTGGTSNIRRLEGLDIKVGGEGMKGYYDQILPQVANDVIKQLGGKNKVKPMNILLNDLGDDYGKSEQLGFEITPEMIKFIKEEAGIPKFKQGGKIDLETEFKLRRHYG